MSDKESETSSVNDAPVPTVTYNVGVETEVPNTGGNLFKTVLTEGTGTMPIHLSKVSVHYVGTLASDGSKFDSSRDRNEPFTFTIGEGQVIKGWDSGVATMKIGEKATLRCLPVYAYGAKGQPPKIPPNAILNFEVELLDWTKDEDISEEHDKSIMKCILKEGSGYDKPEYESEVTVNVQIVVGGKQTVSKEAWCFTIGVTELPVGLEKLILSMKKDEEAKGTVVGRLVQQDEAYGIQAGEEVQYHVTVQQFVSIKTWEVKGMDKVTEATKRKEQGNAYFKAGLWSKATQKYKRGLEFVEHSYGLEPEIEVEAKKLKVVCYNNLAQVLINEKKYKEVLDICNKALAEDTGNVKALFRRAKAYSSLEEWDDGRNDLIRILDLDSHNEEAKRELALLDEKVRQYDQKMKARFSKLFQ